MLFQPIVRQQLDEFLQPIARPRSVLAEMQVTGDRLFRADAISEVAWDISDESSLRVLDLSHTVILLPALAAEHERQKHLLPLTIRDKLLIGQREMAVGFRFDGCVNGIAATDELVQPKRKRRTVRLRITLASEAGLQCLANRFGAPVNVGTGDGTEFCRSTIIPTDPSRRDSLETAAIRIHLDAKRAFNPTGQRIVRKVVEA